MSTASGSETNAGERPSDPTGADSFEFILQDERPDSTEVAANQAILEVTYLSAPPRHGYTVIDMTPSPCVVEAVMKARKTQLRSAQIEATHNPTSHEATGTIRERATIDSKIGRLAMRFARVRRQRDLGTTY